jgi:hypothetical protein
MTPAEARAALAGVLTAAGVGISGQPDPPVSISPGMGWPVWSYSVPLASGQEVTWEVFVALTGASQAAAMAEADRINVTVTDALLDIGSVTEVRPVAMATDATGAGSIPCLRWIVTTI